MPAHAAMSPDPIALHADLVRVCPQTVPLSASPWAAVLAESAWHTPATLVARPDTYESAAAVVRIAAAAGAVVVPIGSGTHLGWGTAPARVDILLDLHSFNGIVEYVPDDMYVTVQAGCSYRTLQDTLARHGQYIPADPAGGDTSTVGGIVACDPPGNWRSGLGPLRDFVIGTRVLQASGDITKSGSKVMKSVAGLELPKLYTGSLGTLGVLLEITFKVRPLPAHQKMVVAPLASWIPAEEALAAIRDSALQPMILELVNAQATRYLPAMESTHKSATAKQKGPMLVVGFGGTQADVDWQIMRCGSMLASFCEPLPAAIVNWSDWYPALHKLLLPPPGSIVSLAATLMSSEVAAFCADAEQIGRQSDLAVLVSARGGCGQVSLHLGANRADTGDRSIISALTEAALALQERAHALPGSVPGFHTQACGNAIVVQAPPEIRAKVPAWGHKPVALALMQAVKQRLDPAGIFNPGRYVGGI